MASTINADDGVVSGSAGVKTSADNSGVLELQSNGTTQFTLGSSSVVINEAGADVDFRVESDTVENALFVQGSDGYVGVGTNAPSYPFHVVGSGDTVTAVTGGATSVAALNLGNSTNLADGGIRYDNSTDALIFRANNGEKARIDSSGNLGLGVTPSASASTDCKQIALGGLNYISSTNGTSGKQNFLTGLYYNAYQTGDTTFNAIVNNSGDDYKPAAYVQIAGQHRWYNASSATANSAITFTQALSVGLGTSLALQGATSQTGTGITFPATQSASSNANTLDDYEEGTWTPNVGGNATYNVQEGFYTKIGKVVFVRGKIQINAIGTGNTQYISGLPFSSQDESTIPLDKSQNLSVSVTWISLRTSVTTLYATYRTAADTSSTINPNFMTSATELQFSGCYYVA